MYWVKQRARYFPCLVGQVAFKPLSAFIPQSCDIIGLCSAFETTRPWCIAEELLLCHLLPILHLWLSLSKERISHFTSPRPFSEPFLFFSRLFHFLSFVTYRFCKHTSYSSNLAVSEDIGQDQEQNGHLKNVFSSFLSFWQWTVPDSFLSAFSKLCCLHFTVHVPVLGNVKNVTWNRVKSLLWVQDTP